MEKVTGIKLTNDTKAIYFLAEDIELNNNDMVVVESDNGIGMGHVVTPPTDKTNSPVIKTEKLKKVIRKADTVDIERYDFNCQREKEAFDVCSEKIIYYNLPMKLVKVEYLFDASKAIFYFVSETRVDFRRLVKDLAAKFYTRIEMKQIGVRDQSKLLGGIGPCGRELCCSSFLSDFAPVTVRMAKEQNLSMNPSKISGMCGRLMCCLSYEHEGKKGKTKGGANSKGGSCCSSGGCSSGGCSSGGCSSGGCGGCSKKLTTLDGEATV